MSNVQCLKSKGSLSDAADFLGERSRLAASMNLVAAEVTRLQFFLQKWYEPPYRRLLRFKS
jgi:hypothetical protein